MSENQYSRYSNAPLERILAEREARIAALESALRDVSDLIVGRLRLLDAAAPESETARAEGDNDPAHLDKLT